MGGSAPPECDTRLGPAPRWPGAEAVARERDVRGLRACLHSPPLRCPPSTPPPCPRRDAGAGQRTRRMSLHDGPPERVMQARGRRSGCQK